MADPASPSRSNEYSNPASPEHASDSNTNPKDATEEAKPLARKDRECPFCHQSFTSSSLGRHLDLFIREKNPKPPDGVHDVERIRKLRSTITRRHARNSSSSNAHVPAARSPSTSQSIAAQPPPLESIGQPAAPVQPPIQQSTPSSFFNKTPTSFRHPKLDWTATGVINDLPPRSNGPLPSLATLDQQQPSSFPPSRELFDTEQARATELALKEVLRSVRSAKGQVKEQPLFDFDFYNLDFPSLTLHLLSRPAALFSSTPIRSNDTWPLEAPGDAERDAMLEVIARRVHSAASPPAATPPTNGSPPSTNPNPAPYTDHLAAAHASWTALPAASRTSLWHLSLQRAYAAAHDARTAAESRLARVQAELAQLQAHVDWWKDTAAAQQRSLAPPLSVGAFAPPPPLSADDAARLPPDPSGWDFDRLVARWKAALPASSSSAGYTSLPPIPTQPPPASASPRPQQQPPPPSRSDGAFLPRGPDARTDEPPQAERTVVPTDGSLAPPPGPSPSTTEQPQQQSPAGGGRKRLSEGPTQPQRRTSSRRLNAQYAAEGRRREGEDEMGE